MTGTFTPAGCAEEPGPRDRPLSAPPRGPSLSKKAPEPGSGVRCLVELRKGKHNLLAAKERGDEYQNQKQQAPFRREIDPAWLQQPPASAERALADASRTTSYS
jgi:hypothetical protein